MLTGVALLFVDSFLRAWPWAEHDYNAIGIFATAVLCLFQFMIHFNRWQKQQEFLPFLLSNLS